MGLLGSHGKVLEFLLVKEWEPCTRRLASTESFYFFSLHVLHASVRASVCASVGSSVRPKLYVSAIFYQTVVIGASWDKDELIGFGVKRSKIKVTCDGGVQHSMLSNLFWPLGHI